jgi:hypothetical protein
VPPHELEPLLRQRVESWSSYTDEDTLDEVTTDAAPVQDRLGVLSTTTTDCYQVVLLRVPGVDRPVAAAALRLESREPCTVAFELIGILGQALYEAGDVTVAS